MQTIVYVLATDVELRKNPNGLVVLFPTGLIVRTLCYESGTSFKACSFYHMTFPDSVLGAEQNQIVDSRHWAEIVNDINVRDEYKFSPENFFLGVAAFKENRPKKSD